MADATSVDVVVIGVGTCGEDLSLRLLDAGLEVVGIEAELVGGECAYWACLPTKRMIRAANLLAEAQRVEGVAGRVAVSPDWGVLAERVSKEVTGGWDDSYAFERFTNRGGHLVRGRGKLAGTDTVAVDTQTFKARHGVVIATGSVPAIPPIPGLHDIDYWTPRDIIKARELPASLAIVGGGAVACELGQVLSRFGVDVAILEAQDRLLPSEEPEAAEVIAGVLAAEGIEVHLGSAAKRVEAADGLVTLALADGRQVAAERVLVAAGRRVDLTGLGLEAIGIDPASPRLDIDARMRVADGIWAMGDVTDKGMFTHVALHQAAIIAADLLGEEAPPARYTAVPRATFTDPEVGAVGFTEIAATRAGIATATVVKQLPATFRGWLHTTGSEGVIKLVLDRHRGVVIGATAVGPHGGEMLGFLALAVHAELPLATLQSMIYAFPTFHGSIGEAIGAYGRGLGTVIDPEFVAPDPHVPGNPVSVPSPARDQGP